MVFASTVRFTTNTASNPFWGLWVGLLSGYIVSLTGEWLSLFWGVACLVVLVVLARGLHPVSFPNLEVKPFCADGTATGGLWESRALPTVSLKCGGGVDPSGVGTPTTILFVFGGGCWTTPKIFLTCEVRAWGKGALTSVGRLKI